MRTDPDAFAEKNLAPNKVPRYVAEIAFDTDYTDLVYITSHADAATPVGATVYAGLIPRRGISGTSQKLNTREGRATIGSLTLKLVDKSSQLTELIYAKLQDSKGLREKRVRVYMGFEGLAWDDYRLIQTQIVDGVSFAKGEYTLKCADVQRSERKDIFRLAETTLSASIDEVDELIPVATVTGFDAVAHGTSFSDAPGETVGYVLIEDEVVRWTGTGTDGGGVPHFIAEHAETTLAAATAKGATEITLADASAFRSAGAGYIEAGAPRAAFRWTGKSGATLTGCSGVLAFAFGARVVDAAGRGALNTRAAAHEVDPNTPADRREKVAEFVYLEMPAPKLAYALLTGTLYNQGGATLPDGWHLNIGAEWVRTADFTGIGADMWDPADDTAGYVLRFAGLQKEDGKRFIEQQLLFPMLFSPVYATGELGLKRLTGVLSDASHVEVLNTSNVVSHGALEHAMREVVNLVEIAWNWSVVKEDYTRRNLLIDETSIAMHQDAPIETIELRGLHGSRHTTDALFWVFDTWRDRYAGPPEKMRATVLPSLNRIEVGDIVRVQLPHVRDAAAGAAIDRAFEVQGVSVDWMTGRVTLDLFGSSQKAGAIQRSTLSSVLEDTAYQVGTELTAYLDANHPGSYAVTGGVLHITSNITLVGAEDLSSGLGHYHYLGDVQIDADVTVTLTENVALWVAGHWQVNGSVSGVGQGLPGVAYAPTQAWDAAGTPGYFGSTQAQGGMLHFRPRHEHYYYGITAVAAGAVPSLPGFGVFAADVGSVVGLPSDLRGTSGGPGGGTSYWSDGWVKCSDGGDGGAGGAGLVSVSRGVSIGINGAVDLSGADGTPGAYCSTDQLYGGGGAGGAPGGWVCILDGNLAVSPDTSRFLAANGETPTQGNLSPVASTSYILSTWLSPSSITLPVSSGVTGISLTDRRSSAFRLIYLSDPEDAAEDIDSGPIVQPSALSLDSGTDALQIQADGTIVPRIMLTWTAPADSRVTHYDIELRPSGESAWAFGTRVDGRAAETGYLTDVIEGTAYDVRVRAASEETGEASVWVAAVAHTVVGKSEPPPTVTGFIAMVSGGTVVFRWDAVTDPDLSGYEIRFGPAGIGYTWEDATPLTVAVRGTKITDAAIPPGDWTFFIKAVDTSGNYSVTASTYSTSVESAYDIIFADAQAPGWSGTLTNFVRHYTGALVPRSQTLASADGWDTFDLFVPNPYAECIYEAPEQDSLYDDTVRVWADIGARLGPGEEGLADPHLQIDYRTEAGAYDGFEDWSFGEVVARYVKQRLVLDTSRGLAYVSTFTPTVDILEWTQKGVDVTVPVAGLAIVFDKPFHQKPYVRVFPQGATPLVVMRSAVSNTGFTAHVFDTDGTDVGGVIDWDATGV